MTDLVTPTSSDDAVPATESSGAPATKLAPGSTEPDVQWADSEPAPKKHRWGLWAGVAAGVIAVGAITASFFIIAPGTTIAGVPVGFLTPGAARDALDSRLANTTVTLGEGGPTLSAKDLGATVNTEEVVSTAFDERRGWNVGQWFGDDIAATVTVDEATTIAALQSAAPDLFVAPVNATVSFEGGTYLAVPAQPGEGIDPKTIISAVEDAFATGKTSVTIDPTMTEVAAVTTTETAQATAAELNGALDAVGFYVGEEKVVEVDRATAASWISVTDDGEGGLTVTTDGAQIQALVDTLPEQINQEAKNGTVITTANGTVLSTVTEGQDGRVMGSTEGLGEKFASELQTGNAVFALPVEVTTAQITELARLLEVDLSEQRLYMKENGEVIDSWPISSGRAGANTYTGRYSIGWKTPIQDMRGVARDGDGKTEYIQEDVRWAMYFNGDQAFHGVYWHNNFGTRMSAGCVGMPDWRAEQIYNWAPSGADVWIHD